MRMEKEEWRRDFAGGGEGRFRGGKIGTDRGRRGGGRKSAEPRTKRVGPNHGNGVEIRPFAGRGEDVSAMGEKGAKVDFGVEKSGGWRGTGRQAQKKANEVEKLLASRGVSVGKHSPAAREGGMAKERPISREASPSGTRLRVRRYRSDTPGWRNWQTRTVEGRVGEIPWGFKSPSRHHLDTILLRDSSIGRAFGC